MKLYIAVYLSAMIFGAALATTFVGTLERRQDNNGGWCLHSKFLMVCSEDAASDYVLGAIVVEQR